MTNFTILDVHLTSCTLTTGWKCTDWTLSTNYKSDSGKHLGNYKEGIWTLQMCKMRRYPDVWLQKKNYTVQFKSHNHDSSMVIVSPLFSTVQTLHSAAPTVQSPSIKNVFFSFLLYLYVWALLYRIMYEQSLTLQRAGTFNVMRTGYHVNNFEQPN